MRKFAAISVLAFAAWILVTFAWAGAAHLTGLPGPARASAASMELAASVVTLVEPPGALGMPQRTAARLLRRAGRLGERLHRGPERAVARVLDRLGHRHGAVWAMREIQVGAPGISFEFPADRIQRARARASAAAERARAAADRARAAAERERARAERDASLDRARIERLRSRLERARTERLHLRLRRTSGESSEVTPEQRERLERGLEVLRERLSRLEAMESEVSRRLEERLRDVLREIERELERSLEGTAEEIADVLAESADGSVRIRIR